MRRAHRLWNPSSPCFPACGQNLTAVPLFSHLCKSTLFAFTHHILVHFSVSALLIHFPHGSNVQNCKHEAYNCSLYPRGSRKLLNVCWFSNISCCRSNLNKQLMYPTNLGESSISPVLTFFCCPWSLITCYTAWLSQTELQQWQCCSEETAALFSPVWHHLLLLSSNLLTPSCV